MKRFLIFLAFVSIILCASCNSNHECEKGITGTIINTSSLDGCQWIIELENGEKLQAVNLTSFEIELKDGMKISLIYKKIEDVATICMKGIVVELTCLSLL